MRSHRLSKCLFAIGASALLAAAPAAAHSGHQASVTLSNYSTSAYPAVTMSVDPGAEVDNVTIDFPAGFQLAHAGGYGSEISPIPSDEDQIGTGYSRVAWIVLFCASTTQTITWTWEEDMTGAPSGAVAHWVESNALGFTTNYWVIEENDATDDYKLVADFDQSLTCTTQPSNQTWNLSLVGTTSSGGHVVRNPSASGCYVFNFSWADVNGTSHSGSDDVAIGGASCP